MILLRLSALYTNDCVHINQMLRLATTWDNIMYRLVYILKT